MNKRPYILVAVGVVVVVVLAGLGAWAYVHRSGVQKGPHFVEMSASTTPQGAVVGPVITKEAPGYFPQGLVIGAGPDVLLVNGVPPEPAGGRPSGTAALPTGQYVLRWNSTSSLSQLYSAYKQYFTQNKWHILGGASTSTAYRAISAKPPTAGATSTVPFASVTIVSQGSGAVVNVIYFYQK